MPTYQYTCSSCGHRFEAVQSFSDDALKTCPECGQDSLRKLFGNVGVVFKGSGFYRNDARAEEKKKGSARAKSTGDGVDSSASASDSKATKETKTEAKPASTTESKTTATKSSDKPAGNKPSK